MRKSIPDVVADNLPKELLQQAWVTGDKEFWSDVENDTRRLLNTYYGASGVARPPGRRNREVPQEIAVKPSAKVIRRAETFTEVAATMGNEHPQVKQFRRMHQHDRLLTDGEARSFLDIRCDGPFPTRHGAKAVSRKLWKLAEKLSKIYSWREGDAMWFILTGNIPPANPLEARVFISSAADRNTDPMVRLAESSIPRYIATTPNPAAYHPNTARITITADAWVEASEIERTYRDAQSQILDGDGPARPMSERTSEVIKFVANRIRNHGRETWEQRRKAWNDSCSKEWRYNTYSGLRRTFKRFYSGHVRRIYKLPKYQRPEKTPYQEYRDDWLNERKDATL